jgi:hypothetical protein
MRVSAITSAIVTLVAVATVCCCLFAPSHGAVVGIKTRYYREENFQSIANRDAKV